MVAPHPPSTTDIPAAGEALLPVSLDAVRFDAPFCRNCGAALIDAYCARCGQKHAIRLGARDLGRETWERWRLFEFDSLRTAARLLYAPGRIAREYVLGMRKRNFHPLKLLLVAVALLALALARANYLQSHRFGEVNQAMALVANYANWSFSLGILAILIASLLVFPRRLGYRPVEHLVLAAYCQSLILLLILLNLLPTLFGASAEFVQVHKSASSHYLFAVKAIVVAVAFKQFYVVDLRRRWWQWLAAIAVYLAANWALSRLYARLVLWYVMPVPA